MNYSNNVLTGNWSEERLKILYELQVFIRKKERNELLLQRSRLLFSNLLKEKPMAMSGSAVLYDFNIQIISQNMPVMGVSRNHPQYGLALSCLVDSRQVDIIQNIKDGCLLTLSPILAPCCRNSFVIVSTGDDSKRGERLCYGDEFYLKAEDVDPNATPLYVRYAPSAIPEPSNRMPIRLSSLKDSNSRWVAMPLLAKQHLELQGCPIEAGLRIVIKNCVAAQNLCVMNQNWMQTFFGPECGVTCRNYIDHLKRVRAENIFSFISIQSKK